MKSWKYSAGQWLEWSKGLALRSPRDGWTGDRQLTVGDIEAQGYKLLQEYSGPGTIVVFLYELAESNPLGSDFLILVSTEQEEHLVLLFSLPDMLDWLARYGPTLKAGAAALVSGVNK